MTVLNYRSVRKKWFENFFMYHGIQKVARSFESNSLEVLLFENLLFSFFEHININNRYELMGGLDYDLFKDKFYDRAMSLMTVLNEKTSETDFEISYKNHVMYVELK